MTFTDQDVALMDRVVAYANPNIPDCEKPEFTEEDLRGLHTIVFESQEGRALGRTTWKTLESIQGKAAVLSFGKHYSDRMGLICADLYNGKEKAYCFLNAMAELMKQQVETQH